MPDVTMPKLSDTMDEGKILRWLKSPGDRVQAGEILAEVETDKADMELEAAATGVVRELRVREGELAPVGAVIAVIDDGTATSDAPRGAEPPAGNGAQGARTAASDAGEVRGGERKGPATAQTSASPSPAADAGAESPGARRNAGPAPAAAAMRAATPRPETAPPGLGLRVSPLARSLAADLGIDLADIVGTGPGGRITRADVEAEQRRRGGAVPAEAAPAPAAGARPASPRREREPHSEAPAGASPAPRGAGDRSAPEVPSAGGPPGTVRVRPAALARAAGRATPPAPAASGVPGGARVRRVPLSRMRTSIARRMVESKREAPHFYVTTVAEMDAAVELRAALKQLGAEAAGVTFNHMVIKAVAAALQVAPELNARFAGDAVELFEEVNVGVATAVDDGLVVPVVHRADRLSLFEIATRARELAERAASDCFAGDDLTGATFSVSNLGMFDVDSFVAVINPPQAAILAVGSVKQRPVVRDGALGVGHTVALTLSCDHRCVDGVRAARFLADVKRRLESPIGLLVEQAPAVGE